MKYLALLILLYIPFSYSTNDSAMNIRLNKANYVQEIRKYGLTPCYAQLLEDRKIPVNNEQLFKFEYLVKDYTEWLETSAFHILYTHPKLREDRQKFYSSVKKTCVTWLNGVYDE